MSRSPASLLSRRGRWILWRARLDGFLHRLIRHSARLFIALLFALTAGASFAQDAPPPAADLVVAGVRIRTKDGKTVEGVIEPGAPEKTLWVKNTDGTFAFPLGDLESREEVSLDLRRVYLPDEVLGILMGRIRPSSAADFDRLGADLLRAKLEDRAVAAFRMAETLRRPEGVESRLQVEIVRLRDRIEDLALRRTVYQAQESCLTGDYDAAIAQIDEVERSMGGKAAALFAEIRRLRAQVEDGRGRARDAHIVEETWRTIEALLKSRAMDRETTFAAAREYVEGSMPDEVRARVGRRFNFTPEDPAATVAWNHRPEDPLRKHAYDEASWFVLRPDARLPEAWWSSAADEARYKLLKGLYLEKHLGPLRAESKNCPLCGGTGLSEEVSCPDCSGLKSHRVLFYR